MSTLAIWSRVVQSRDVSPNNFDGLAMSSSAFSVLKIFGESLSMPTATFPDILMDLYSDNPIDPVNMHTKFEVHSFTRS